MKAKRTNTHEALNRAYDRICDNIKVLEDDAERLLQDIETGNDIETDSNWYSIISSDLSKAYKMQNKIRDDIRELDLYDIEYK